MGFHISQHIPIPFFSLTPLQYKQKLIFDIVFSLIKSTLDWLHHLDVVDSGFDSILVSFMFELSNIRFQNKYIELSLHM